MYPEPHFPADEHRRAREEIRTLGFQADPWLGRLDVPVLGLNVAVHWPLPQVFRAEYERLGAALADLGHAHVYPYQETHVTVATLVSFKRHERPSGEAVEAILGRLPALGGLLDAITRGMRAFEIDVGAPVLVRTAAFLPILNETGEIAAIRRGLMDSLGSDAELQAPRGIHSTVLRFRQTPDDAAAFVRGFETIASSVRFGRARVDEILITTETLPYMMAGRIVHRNHLELP